MNSGILEHCPIFGFVTKTNCYIRILCDVLYHLIIRNKPLVVVVVETRLWGQDLRQNLSSAETLEKLEESVDGEIADREDLFHSIACCFQWSSFELRGCSVLMLLSNNFPTVIES